MTSLASFVVFQSHTCSVATLKVYLYAVRARVLARGSQFEPWGSRYPVYSAMQGLERLFGTETARKLAVTPKLLLQFVILLNIVDVMNDIMLWGAMVVAFFGLFRKDNITSGKVTAFNPRAHLCVGDLHVTQEGVVWLKVRHSKTNQFRARYHWVPLVPMPNHRLCPVRAVLRVLAIHRQLGSSPETALFLWRGTRGQVTAMTHGVFVQHFMRLVRAVGLDWKQYAGHSFRRGGATYCFNLGVDPELIKMLGDWKSNAYLLYEEVTVRRRLELPQAMVLAIRAGVLDHGPRLG